MENIEQRFNKLPGFFQEYIVNNNIGNKNDPNFQIEVFESAVLIGKRYKTEEELNAFKKAISPPNKKFESLARARFFYNHAAEMLAEVFPEDMDHNISRHAILSSFDLAKTYLQLEKENTKNTVKKENIKDKFKKVRKKMELKFPNVDTGKVKIFNPPAFEKEDPAITITFDKDRDY
jgi:hypothetical protein